MPLELVRETRVELARAQCPRDFKSRASAYSAIPAYRCSSSSEPPTQSFCCVINYITNISNCQVVFVIVYNLFTNSSKSA